MSRKRSSLVLRLAWVASAVLGGVGAVLRGPRSARLIAGLIAAVVLGAVTAVSFHRSTTAPGPTGAQAAVRQRPQLVPPNDQRSAGSRADYDPAVPEPPTPIPRVSPTAPWLAAPPTPILVDVAADEARTSRQRITPAGGQLSISTPDGTRITLAVPPDALVHSQEITMTLVSSVSGLPFGGGLVAAVRVAPDVLPLRAPATLTFETRSGFARDQEVAGIAIRDGREFHLYPADRIEDAKAKGRGRVDLRLARLGSYGVARATAAEVADVLRRVPSGYIARLEQLIAQAFPPVHQPSGQASTWSLLPVVYAQEAPAPVPEWLSDLFRSFEETFEQVIVPQFRYIPEHGCESITTWAAISMSLEWAVLPTLLFPVEREHAPWDLYWKLVNQRIDMLHDRGYDDQQIAEIDAAMDAFRQQRLSELLHRADPLLEEAYRRLFAKMYECCRWGRPMQYHLERMLEILRMGELEGVTPLDPDESQKVAECSCRIASVRQGAPEIWTGTITHDEEYDAESVRTPGGTRTETQTLYRKYRQELVLEWAVATESMASRYTIEGRETTHAETKDRLSCGEVHATRDASGSARDDGETTVMVAAQPGRSGKYRISYPVNGATGSALWKSHWSAEGCQIFNPVRDDRGVRAVTIVGHPHPVWIETEADPARPHRLSGSKVLEVPDKVFDTPRRPKISWNLQRCGG